MSKIFILLTCIFSFVSACQPPEMAQIPDKYLGNWFDPEGDEYWSLAITPHFVISDEKFWKPEKILGNDSAFSLHLSLENQKKELRFQLVNDSTIKIGEKEYVKNQEGIKRKSKKNQLSLESGKAVIMGYVKNYKKFYDKTERISFSVADFILSREKSHYATIDSASGKFKVAIDLNGPQDVYFKYHHTNVLSTIFLHPNDTLIMFIDAEKYSSEEDNTQFMGKYADVNYDIYYMNKPYKSFIPSYQEINKALDTEPEEYYQFRKDYHEKQLLFLKEYCQTSGCSEVFQTWFRKKAEVEMYKELMNYSWKSFKYGMGSPTRLVGKKREDYKALFMDSINLNDSLYQLTSSYFFFLNPLSQSMINFRDSLHPKQEFNRIIEVMLSLSNQKPENKNPNEDIVFLNSLCAYSTEKDIPDHKKEKWWSLLERYDEEIKITKKKFHFDWLLNKIQRVENANLRDLYLCNYFHRGYLEMGNVSLADYGFQKVKNIIQNKEYLAKLTAEYYHLKKEEKRFRTIEMKRLKNDKDGELLLKSILEENQNKVLLIDFWATSCGPCLSDFKLMKEIKERFIGKDIAFIYLCCESTEKNWQHLVKKFDVKGSHFLLSTKQHYDLQERFQVNAYPTYLLIDKQRNIIRDVPRPSDPGGLVSFLSKYTSD